MSMAADPEATGVLSPHALDQLIESRRRFLAFVQKRVSSPEAAEDILQSAFMKGIERGSTIHDEESVVAWFYRVLRNAIIDYYRHQGAADRVAEALARDVRTHVESDDAVKGEVCQ